MSKKSYEIFLLFLMAAMLSACTEKRNQPVESSSAMRQWKSNQAEFYDNRVTVINRRGCDMYALYLSP